MGSLRLLMVGVLGLATIAASPSLAQRKYDPGANDSEIKIGNIMPYSGPISSYSVIGKTETAYFEKINAEGGINGRKIKFISYDDSSNPAKTVEQARKLVEGDEVLLIFQSLGGSMNIAIEKYLNDRKVPQLFVSAPNKRFGDPKNFPWTMGWSPTADNEGRIYAQYLLKNHPSSRVGVLYLNVDVGKEYLMALKEGLDGKMQVVAEVPYEITDPTVDSQVISLKESGADIIFLAATPKTAVQAIRRMAELDWKPIRLLASISNSIGAVMKPAGLEVANGILSAGYLKDPSDPLLKDDPAVKEWEVFMAKYYPEGDRTNTFTAYGYLVAQTMVQVLRQCGDDLTRENVMRQAANIKDLELGLLLPGIKINTSPTDYFPVKHMQMTRFNGETIELLGPLYSGVVAGN
ncbi:ABC transporter substrate-binding protein [Bradyrhizobium erythrophlei]|jgi:branched-chain amino acid transport system substrate-binding protein|uniref:Amino acid/amide ABC transporter substrate-binding protein, HAAT family n=1 Tax=Bradyrhizobium erythrophlei TaxID=1437360 RepID=A0A1M7TRE2_9BRAD|nr:ABC transporter substrate-binding protein [Bradyrhizobium erythrophlei]SHN73311.1 amino acid/amide ABC transporter substrate-binding protein, HAAT family [Bradyrhizobium erythrophlei]